MSRKITNGLDLLNRPIDNVADPGSPQQAATKNYVDGAVRGLDYKYEVIAASTGNVSLAAPGGTLDGVTLSAGMQVLPGIGTVTRILLKDQTAPAENGIWDWNGAAAALTRSTDADAGTELSGATVTVQRGTVNADRLYHCNTDDPIVIGTTGITWAQVGAGGTAYLAGNGLSLAGSTFNVVPGSGILADGTSTRIDPNVVVRKYATTIGDGSATSYTVTHNFGTRDVQVTVFDLTTDALGAEVLADVGHPSGNLNTVVISFATAPITGQYRVVVQG